MICIMRIYNRVTKSLVKEIKLEKNPKSIFQDWLLEQKKDDQGIESFYIDSINKYIAFYHIVTDIDEDMRCGKIEIIIKNKKPNIIEQSTNLLFELSCTCCSEVQSIGRCMVYPEFNNNYFQYYLIDKNNSKTPVSILNKLEFLFLENNYWQKLLLNQMKKLERKRMLGQK